MLIEYTMKSSAESASSLNLVAVDDEILSVSAIATQTSTAESFYVEGEISLPEHFQRFYLLGCSECNHLVRSKIRREIQCINCRLPRMLIPRCHFEVEITDETGTITTMSKGLGERILSMTAEQIYDITAVKNELFPVAHINQLLINYSEFNYKGHHPEHQTKMQVLWFFCHTLKNQPCFYQKSQHLRVVPTELWKKSQYL
uniref:Replication protein A 70 kDa DNA-binding subunit B-like n=1 Tax=Nicotiana tabacum TaxID=4097 RepID=A0A1S4AYX0_TOBAC|nr:PREDICTED: uncharacterized protein LOC107802802 [Nicotiana tabacum]XP_016481862.1 PREDICTED: uncharacterized protein LOC107802802 [Nicotiana tabacum]XP_016481863.1 PREDICTED: uncharacterized protein LOC107802802 [Nicotiana tabacum]